MMMRYVQLYIFSLIIIIAAPLVYSSIQFKENCDDKELAEFTDDFESDNEENNNEEEVEFSLFTFQKTDLLLISQETFLPSSPSRNYSLYKSLIKEFPTPPPKVLLCA